MFNGQSGGWAWYPTPSNATPTHLSLAPTPTSAQLSGQISREEIQKRGELQLTKDKNITMKFELSYQQTVKWYKYVLGCSFIYIQCTIATP